MSSKPKENHCGICYLSFETEADFKQHMEQSHVGEEHLTIPGITSAAKTSEISFSSLVKSEPPDVDSLVKLKHGEKHAFDAFISDQGGENTHSPFSVLPESDKESDTNILPLDIHAKQNEVGHETQKGNEDDNSIKVVHTGKQNDVGDERQKGNNEDNSIKVVNTFDDIPLDDCHNKKIGKYRQDIRRIFPCSKCMFKFDDPISRYLHLVQSHADVFPSCEMCHKRFVTKGEKTKHFKLTHGKIAFIDEVNGTLRFKCKVCYDNKFDSFKEFLSHLPCSRDPPETKTFQQSFTSSFIPLVELPRVGCPEEIKEAKEHDCDVSDCSSQEPQQGEQNITSPVPVLPRNDREDETNIQLKNRSKYISDKTVLNVIKRKIPNICEKGIHLNYLNSVQEEAESSSIIDENLAVNSTPSEELTPTEKDEKSSSLISNSTLDMQCFSYETTKGLEEFSKTSVNEMETSEPSLDKIISSHNQQTTLDNSLTSIDKPHHEGHKKTLGKPDGNSVKVVHTVAANPEIDCYKKLVSFFKENSSIPRFNMFPCSECSSHFTDSISRQIHVMQAHPNLLPSCEMCHKLFVTNGEKTRHIKATHGKMTVVDGVNCVLTFPCKICNQVEFNSFEELLYHSPCPCGGQSEGAVKYMYKTDRLKWKRSKQSSNDKNMKLTLEEDEDFSFEFLDDPHKMENYSSEELQKKLLSDNQVHVNAGYDASAYDSQIRLGGTSRMMSTVQSGSGECSMTQVDQDKNNSSSSLLCRKKKIESFANQVSDLLKLHDSSTPSEPSNEHEQLANTELQCEPDENYHFTEGGEMWTISRNVDEHDPEMTSEALVKEERVEPVLSENSGECLLKIEPVDNTDSVQSSVDGLVGVDETVCPETGGDPLTGGDALTGCDALTGGDLETCSLCQQIFHSCLDLKQHISLYHKQNVIEAMNADVDPSLKICVPYEGLNQTDQNADVDNSLNTYVPYEGLNQTDQNADVDNSLNTYVPYEGLNQTDQDESPLKICEVYEKTDLNLDMSLKTYQGDKNLIMVTDVSCDPLLKTCDANKETDLNLDNSMKKCDPFYENINMTADGSHDPLMKTSDLYKTLNEETQLNLANSLKSCYVYIENLNDENTIDMNGTTDLNSSLETCNICNENFENCSQMKDHIQSVHCGMGVIGTSEQTATDVNEAVPLVMQVIPLSKYIDEEPDASETGFVKHRTSMIKMELFSEEISDQNVLVKSELVKDTNPQDLIVNNVEMDGLENNASSAVKESCNDGDALEVDAVPRKKRKYVTRSSGRHRVMSQDSKDEKFEERRVKKYATRQTRSSGRHRVMSRDLNEKSELEERLVKRKYATRSSGHHGMMSQDLNVDKLEKRQIKKYATRQTRSSGRHGATSQDLNDEDEFGEERQVKRKYATRQTRLSGHVEEDGLEENGLVKQKYVRKTSRHVDTEKLSEDVDTIRKRKRGRKGKYGKKKAVSAGSTQKVVSAGSTQKVVGDKNEENNTKSSSEGLDSSVMNTDNMSDDAKQSPSQNICRHCKESFSKKSVLVKHLVSEHPEHLRRCDLCNKVFPYAFLKRKHMEKCHSVQPVVPVTIVKSSSSDLRFQCSQCPERLADKKALAMHSLVQHSKKFMYYPCELCDKVFAYPGLKRKHMTNIHFVMECDFNNLTKSASPAMFLSFNSSLTSNKDEESRMDESVSEIPSLVDRVTVPIAMSASTSASASSSTMVSSDALPVGEDHQDDAGSTITSSSSVSPVNSSPVNSSPVSVSPTSGTGLSYEGQDFALIKTLLSSDSVSTRKDLSSETQQIVVNRRAVENFTMFPCKFCRAEFDSLHKLANHAISLHSGTPRIPERSNGLFPCKFCNQEFSSLPKLGYHATSVHRNQMPSTTYPCDCGRVFSTTSALAQHLRLSCKRNSEARSEILGLKSVGPESKSVGPGLKSVSSETKSVSSESKSVGPESKSVSSETKSVSSESKSVGPESKSVSSETKSVSSESKSVPTESKCVGTESKYVYVGPESCVTTETQSMFVSPESAKPALIPVTSNGRLKPFSCPFCDHCFLSAVHLNNHAQRSHPIRLKPKQKFLCYCGKVFYSKKELNTHQLEHINRESVLRSLFASESNDNVVKL